MEVDARHRDCGSSEGGKRSRCKSTKAEGVLMLSGNVRVPGLLSLIPGEALGLGQETSDKKQTNKKTNSTIFL